MIQEFVSGIHYFFAGFRLLLKPGVKRYVCMPLILNILLFACLFYFAHYYMQHIIVWLQHLLPHWLAWLIHILWGLFYFICYLFFIFTFLLFANVIAAPFNSLLSEQINQSLTQTPSANFSIWQIFKVFPASIKRQCIWLNYYLPRIILLALLFFVPVIQVFATPLWFLFNAWVLALAYCDYPADNKRLTVLQLFTFAKQHRTLSLGFGSTILVCSMIPLINFFVIPAAVAGATKLWIEHYPYENS